MRSIPLTGGTDDNEGGRREEKGGYRRGMNGEEGGECTSSFPGTRRGVEEKGKREEKEKEEKGKRGE